MNHLALQRVMVRMLYDPTLVERVQSDPRAALPGVDLTDREFAWLKAPDPRAWTADPERGARSLTVIVQQYPASMAVAYRAAGSLDPFLDYFRNARFHRCIQTGGSMALEFADHLADLTGNGIVSDARVTPLARLEQAIARLQRTAPARPPGRDPEAAAFVLSPDRDLVRGAAGVAELHAAIHETLAELGGGLAETVLDRGWPIPDRRIRSGKRDPLLLELFRDDGPRVRYGVGVSGLGDDLYALLDFSRRPRSRDELIDHAVTLGAGREEAADLATGLIDEGTWVPAAAEHA